MNKQITTIFISLIVLLNVLIKVVTEENVATITEYKNENQGNGEYNFRFVQSDGIVKEESGRFEGEGNYVVRGYYSYIDPTGTKQLVEYYADSTGYHPRIVKHNDIQISLEPEVITGALPPAAVASLLG